MAYRIIDIGIYLTMYISLTIAYPPVKPGIQKCVLRIICFTALSTLAILLEERLPAYNFELYQTLFLILGIAYSALYLSGRMIEKIIMILTFLCTLILFTDSAFYFEYILFGRIDNMWRMFIIPAIAFGGYIIAHNAIHVHRSLPFFCWLPNFSFRH